MISMDILDAPSVIQRQVDEIKEALRRRKLSKKLLVEKDELQKKLDAENGGRSLKDTSLMKKLDKYLFK